MDRMNEVCELGSVARPKTNASDLSSDQLECLYRGLQADHRRSVLIAKDDDCLFFLKPRIQKLQTVTDRTNIARVRMQDVFGPMLCFIPIISERTYELEFYGPEIRDDEITPLPGSGVYTSGGRCVG